MDSDGFIAELHRRRQHCRGPRVLARPEGREATPGCFTEGHGRGPGSQPITGVGFTPTASCSSPARRHDPGEPDGERAVRPRRIERCQTEGAPSLNDTDGPRNLNSEAIDKTSKVFVKVDNGTPAVDAEADLTALGTDGFTLNWTTNDAFATESSISVSRRSPSPRRA